MKKSNDFSYIKNILYFIGILGIIYMLFMFGYQALVWVALKVLSPTEPKVCTPNTENQSTTKSVFEDSQNLELIGHFGGVMQSIFATDTYLYAGIGPELAVLDVKDPTNPKRIGYTLLSDKVVDIYVEGKYAYVATGESGLRIVDTSNPVVPIEVGAYITSLPINEVIVSKGYAYIPLYKCNYGSFGAPSKCAGAIQIIDVSNSSNPTQVFCHKTSGEPVSMALNGNYAYISVSSGVFIGELVILDILKPAQAKEIVTVDTRFDGDVTIMKDYIYISNGTYTNSTSFEVFDISNKSNPTKVTTFLSSDIIENQNDNSEFTEVNKYVYLINGVIKVLDFSNPPIPSMVSSYNFDGEIENFSLTKKHLYIISQPVIEVIDITNPYSLVKIGEYQNTNSAYNLEVIDNLLYVASGDNNFQSINILDPKFPFVVGSLSLPEEIKNTETGDDEKVAISGLAIDEDLAYLAISDLGIQIVDISNPNAPVEFGFYPIANGIGDIAMDNNNTYITTDSTDFEILSFQSNTFNKIGSFNMPSNFNNVVIGDNFIYFLGENNGIWTVDISNSNALTFLDYYQMSTHVYDMETDSKYFYFATTKGIQIVKLTDEGFLIQEPHIILEDLIFEKIMLENNFIYAIDDNNLWVLNISNPSQPIIEGTYTAENDIKKLVKEGDYIYLAIKENEVLIINAKLPSNLVEVGSYSTDRILGDIEVINQCLYLASAREGLKIIDTTNPISPIEINFSMENIREPRDITTVGNYTYISTRNNFFVLDITNSCQPSVIKQYEVPEISYRNPEAAWGWIIAASSDYAFMRDYTDDSLLWILDISTPSNPQKIKYYKTMRGSSALKIQGNYAYLLQKEGLRVIDITNPILPTETGSYFEKFVDMNDILISENLAYIANAESFYTEDKEDILIFDISNPNKPVKINSYAIPENLSALGIAIDSEYLYIATGADGIFIFKLK